MLNTNASMSDLKTGDPFRFSESSRTVYVVQNRTPNTIHYRKIGAMHIAWLKPHADLAVEILEEANHVSAC